MKTTYFFLKPTHLLFIFLSVLICLSGSQAQSNHPIVGHTAYQAALEAELSHSARDRYLYEHADVYSRLVQIRALKRLGYDLMNPETMEPVIQDADIPDSGSAKNISKNPADQNETTIAINRENSKLIVTGANDTRMYSVGMPAFTSSDEGKTWRNYLLPLPVTDLWPVPYGDPALAVDDSGYFYYAYLSGDNMLQNDNLIVATSKDGKIWKNGGFVVSADSAGGFEDKEHITVDQNPKSPFYGRVYLVWMHFPDNTVSFTGGARVVWSDDKCKTWSDAVTVTDTPIEFAEVKVGMNGELILTFSSIDGSGGGTHNMYLSTDGGQTYSSTSFANYTNYPTNDVSRPGLKGPAGFRCFPYIAEDIDLKTNQIHLVYGTYNAYDTIPAAAVLYYVTSTDLGVTWSTPSPVGIANPNHSTLSVDRFCPWVSVNQRTGDAYAVYYSSEDDTVNNELITVYRAKLSGGMTEYPRFIGDRDFDPVNIDPVFGAPPFIGDYIGSDAFDTVYAAAWTENRTVTAKDGDIFVYVATPKSPMQVTGIAEPVIIRSVGIWLSAPLPNPVSGGVISFSYYLPHEAIAEIALYSDAGVKVKTFAAEKSETGTYSQKYSLEGLSSGTYILRVSTPYGSAQRNLIITK